MVVDRVEPAIGHVPIRRAAPGTDLEIRATVNGPDPIDTVYLIYGNDRAGYTQKPLTTAEASIYRATIPLDPDETHEFKFVVDGVWRCSLDFATVTDPQGNVNNVIRPDHGTWR